MRSRRVFAAWMSLLCSTALVTRVSAQAPPPMQSGGLAPPPPGSGPPPPPPPQQNVTQRTLEEAERDDSGRGLEFIYVEAGGGATFLSLDALGSNGVLLPDSKTSGLGPVVSVASGIRLLYGTIGPRFRYGHFGDWDVWTLNLDLGWRIPLGRLEPYAFIGGGFAKLTSSGLGESRLTVSATGFDIRLGGGVDYYVTNVFSVGGTLSAELLRLSRSGGGGAAPLGVLVSDASSVGLAVTAGAMVGLHF